MLTIKGCAKINLTLDILGKRPDGYHEVSMIMQSIGLSDTLTLERTAAGIALSCDVPDLATDGTNLAYKAAALLMGHCHIKGGVAIKLTKRIPIAAGLAGGSTDAAAVLRGMNELFGLGLSLGELCALGEAIGSDVPFCIVGGTMLATGRGEKLTPLSPLPATPVVLAKPPVSVSTAWAYRHYDEAVCAMHPDTDGLKKALADKNIYAASKLLCNVLESVTIKTYGVISRCKEIMQQNGALGCLMSGSGPTVFALTENARTAERIASAISSENLAEVFVTRTVNGN